MDYITRNISINLKRIRASKNMSLDAVADHTGVSKSMLAQLERGEANPSIGILMKIVSGLKVEFDELIVNPPVDMLYIDKNQLIPTKEVPGQYAIYTCFPYEKNRGFEVYRIEIEPEGEYVSGSHGEKTSEYIVVSSGVLTLTVNDTEYNISEKDGFRFESDRRHVYANHGKEVTSVIVCLMS